MMSTHHESTNPKYNNSQIQVQQRAKEDRALSTMDKRKQQGGNGLVPPNDATHENSKANKKKLQLLQGLLGGYNPES